MKKFLALLLAAVVTCTSAIALGGCTETVEGKDENKTQLYIGNYNGGVGEKWLDNLKIRFEQAYENTEFEPGKKGAQLMIDHNKKYESLTLPKAIPTDQTYEVYFMGGSAYFDLVGNKYLYDLTDVITQKKIPGEDKTIASKMDQTELQAMTVDGKVYAVPHYELYDGPSYDANLFEMNALYFIEEIDTADTTYPGTKKFMPSQTYAGTRSCGPDGVAGTYDDGLPSTVQEFYKLIDKMVQKGVKPFIWTGDSPHYSNQILRKLYANLGGPALVNATYHLDSQGEPIDYVESFDSNGRPVIKQAVITEENAYLVKQSAALYYCLEFAQKVRSDDRNVEDDGFAYDHISTQEAFVNSGKQFNGEDSVAMIIDGSWWWNEANDDDIFSRFEEDYPDTYAQKEFRVMPMPVKYEGTVNEGEGKAPTIAAGHSSLLIVNKNIDENHVKLMEEFVTYVYSQKELLEFTKDTNGILKGINYEYSTVLGNLNSFAQSSLEILEAAKEAGSYIKTFSANTKYRKWSATLDVGNNNWIANDDLMFPIHSYTTKTTLEYVRDHFNRLAISKEAWEK